MDIHHIGSNTMDRQSIEHELICIKNSRLALTIKGKASHPNSNIESEKKLSSVKCNFATDDFSVAIYMENEDKLEGKSYRKYVRPLFFEQRNYEICIEFEKESPDDVINFWHENINIREKITPIGKLDQSKFSILSGVINFGNEIGLSSIFVRINGKDVISLEIEVFPAKLDYQKDYQVMLQDVTDEVYNLAFDFMKKTYQQMDLIDKMSNSDSEFFSIISRIFEKMLRAADTIVAHAHHELQSFSEIVPAHKVKRVDNKAIKWMLKRQDKAVKTVDGKVKFESILTTKKQVNFDTYENRFVKFILTTTYRRLDSVKSLYIGITKNSRKKDIYIVSKIDNIYIEIRKRTDFTFLKNVGKLNDGQSMSLVFAMAPGYKELYRYYLMLQKGLSLHGQIFNMSMKDTALLYEYWCFIKLNNILKSSLDTNGNRKYQLVRQDILKVDKTGLTVTLKKGNTSKVEYVNPKNGEKIELSYNLKKQKLPTITQKPDNVLSLTKRENNGKYEYIFDAKYRINMAEKGSDYARDYHAPGPELDTINAMHRYRDAIVYQNGKNATYERAMFGAYVLFPYDNEQEYMKHQFYKSIEMVNIGGLPFLPGTTAMVEKFLDELIIDSASSAFERATLPKGIEEKLEHVDLTERDVLVGLFRSKEQFEICISKKLYYIPAKEISDERFPIQYVALHQTKEIFGKESGILYYGKVRRCKKVRRSSIREVAVSKRNNGDEPYYYFEIVEWQKLEHKIEVDRMRRSYYTNIHLLQNCNLRQELSLTSMEQLRLYTELRRLSDSVQIKDRDNVVEGFEFNCSYISMDGNMINVHTNSGKDKQYVLSYAAKCMKSMFNEIKADVGCE